MEGSNSENWPLPSAFGSNDDAHLKALLAAWKEDERKRSNRLADAEQIFQHTLLLSREADGTHWNGTGEKHVVFKKEDEKSHLVVGVSLGEGGYGVVKMLLCRSLQMARKKVKGRHDSVKSLANEVQVMEKLAHKHLVKLVGTYTWRSKLYILTFPVAMCNFEQVLDEYEKLQGVDSDIYSDNDERALAGKVVARAMLGVARTKLLLEKGSEEGAYELVIAIGHRLDEILGCLATAVEWMHAQGVRHLDLKPANIVLNPGEIYITDFGLSRDFKNRTSTRTEYHSGFTAGYAAPEVHQEEAYNPSSADVYSLGCIYLHIATVRHAGNRDRCRDILKSIPTSQKPQKRQQAIETYLTKDLWPRFVEAQMRRGDDTGRLPLEFRDLMKAMLSDQPNQRPTVSALNHALLHLGGWQQRYHGSCCKKNRHALSLLSRTREVYSDIANEPADNLCGYLGVTLHKLDSSPGEELNLRDGLQRARQRYGEDDSRTLDIITDLVSCLRGQKNYTEARSISLQMLRRKEMLLGADSSDPEVLELIRNTGILHFLCGQYDDAESTLKRAVNQSKDLLGRQNPETLETIDDLALVLHARGRLVEAEDLYRSLEADKRTVLGKDYSGTLDTLHRLSLVLSDQGKNEEAEKLAVETFENRKRLLGIDHPDILDSMEHLARVLNSTGKGEEAEDILDQLRVHKASLRRRLLGDGHAFNRYICERMDDLRQQRQIQLLEREAALRAAELEELANEENQASPDLSERNSFATSESKAEDDTEHQASTPPSEIMSKPNDSTETVELHSSDITRKSSTANRGDLAETTSETISEEEGEQYEWNVVHVRSPRISAISKHAGFSAFFANAPEDHHNSKSVTSSEEDGYQSNDSDAIDLSSDDSEREEDDPFNFPDDLDELANTAFRSQKFSEAENLYRSILGTKEEIYGANSSRTLKTMHFLGNALYWQQNYDEAQEVLEETLVKRRASLGKRHPDTLMTMFVLGNVYYAKGNLKEASAVFWKTVRLREIVLGHEHPDTILASHHRGFTLLSQYKYDKAIKVIRKTLEQQRRVLGSEHPDTVWSIHNMGYAFHNVSSFLSAEGYYAEALSLRDKTLGEEAPLTLEVLSRLRNVHLSCGNFREAEPLLRRELYLREKSRGERDLLTLESMCRLSTCLWEQDRPSETPESKHHLIKAQADLKKKHEEAEELIVRAVALHRSVLGTAHPTTLSTMYTAAVILKGRGKLEHAKQLYSETLVMRERLLGREHPDTTDTRRGFYLALEGLGGNVVAEAVYQETLLSQPLSETEMWRKAHKTSAQRHLLLTWMVEICSDIHLAHHRVIDIAYAEAQGIGAAGSPACELLYSLLEKFGAFQKKPDQQMREFEQWLIDKAHWEEYHEFKGIEEMAEDHEAQQEYREAEALRREALLLSTKAVGPRHPVTLKIMYRLAQVLEKQGLNEEAKSLYAQVSPVTEELSSQGLLDASRARNFRAALENRRSGLRVKPKNNLRPARSTGHLYAPKDEGTKPQGSVDAEGLRTSPHTFGRDGQFLEVYEMA